MNNQNEKRITINNFWVHLTKVNPSLHTQITGRVHRFYQKSNPSKSIALWVGGKGVIFDPKFNF